MNKTRKLATVAMAAVLTIMTTTTTIGTGIFVQQANAAACLDVLGRPLGCNTNSFISNAFNWIGMLNPSQPYLNQELP